MHCSIGAVLYRSHTWLSAWPLCLSQGLASLPDLNAWRQCLAQCREIIDMLSRELCDMLSQVLLDTPSSALIKRLSRECIDRLSRELIDALSHELTDFSAQGPALKSGTPWRLGLRRAAGAFV